MQKLKNFMLLFSAIALTTLTPSAYSQKSVSVQPNGELERSQTLLMNLKTSPRSAGFFILHSVRTADEMSRDLDRALSQIEAVDATYAKARHRPDSRYLSTVSLKLTQARQTANELHSELEDTWDELKNSIKQTLVSDPTFKL